MILKRFCGNASRTEALIRKIVAKVRIFLRTTKYFRKNFVLLSTFRIFAPKIDITYGN